VLTGHPEIARFFEASVRSPKLAKKVGRVRVKGHEAPILLYQVA